MPGQQYDESAGIKLSIKWKLTMVMTLLMIILVSLLTYIQITHQREILEKELQKRIGLMEENLEVRGKSFMVNLLHQVENDIAGNNFSGVIETIKSSVEHSEEVKYAVLLDVNGNIFVHTRFPDNPQNGAKDIRNRLAADKLKIIPTEYREEDESVIEIVEPVHISAQCFICANWTWKSGNSNRRSGKKLVM